MIQLKSLRVLIVDDEVDYLDTLVERMRMREINVNGVDSGQAALAYLTQEPVDVVILDVRMPGMDGIDTLKELKQRHPLVEVIMLSGHANTEIAIRGMELGAFDYLLKPIEIDLLIYKIQDAHRKKSLQESKISQIANTIKDAATNSGPDNPK